MDGGIGNQVQQRVDAYRSNPEALAMQYQQNQQLIDLLALQKLKSEKEAAARDMQMKMQGEPGTIAEQREQQVQALTQQEVSQKLMGSVPNMEQGVGSLPYPQTPPSGIASFQEGGMVGFQEGGEVKRRQIEDALQKGATIRDLEAIFRNDPEGMAILQQISPSPMAGGDVPAGSEFDSGIASIPTQSKAIPMGRTYRGREGELSALQVGQDVRAAASLPGKAISAINESAPLEGIRGFLTDFMEGLSPIEPAMPKPKTEEPPAPVAAPEQFVVEQAPEAPAAPQFVDTDDQDDDFLKMARTLMAADPQAADEARRKAAQEAYGYTPEELAELREGLDPRSRAWERFRAFGRGAAGGTSGLAALTGGSAASQAEMLRQREQIAKITSANRAIREKAFGEGTGASAQAATERLKGAEIGQRVVGSRRDLLADQMKIAADAALAQNETLMEMAKYDREAAIETRREVSESLASGTSPYSKMYQEALTRLQNAMLKGSDEEVNELRADLSEIMDMAITDIMGASSNSGFSQIRPVGQ
jgi:hypothetical protein